MTTKILLMAPVLTQSGYGEHSRQVVRYLFDLIDGGANIALDIWPIGCGPTQNYVNTSNPLIKRIYENCKRREFEYDVSIQIQMPTPKEWNPALAKKNIGITAGIETDLCNPTWLDTINRMSHVIVPSEYSKATFTKSSERFMKEITTPISVVHEFVNEEYFKKDVLIDPLAALPTNFNFLVFGQITGNDKDKDRKNLFTTIQAIYAAFRNEGSIGVVVKANLGRETELDKHYVKEVLGQVKESVCDYTRGQGNQPQLYCLHGMMNQQELRAIYQSKKIKALLTTTRGEAVGLPIVEAAACGLPVIATDKGGHTEYLADKKWIGLPSTLTAIPQSKVDNELFVQDAKWFEVNLEETLHSLVRFQKNNVKPREWAKEQAAFIEEKFSFEAIRKEFDQVLKPLLLG